MKLIYKYYRGTNNFSGCKLSGYVLIFKKEIVT